MERRTPMQYPVIDIGSNTVKIAVLDEKNFFSSPPIFFKAVPLCLRSKVKNNRLCEEAVEELIHLLESFSQITKEYSTVPPLAFATASLRGLDNADDILAQIFCRTGITVDLISGEKEAYCSFLGAKKSTQAQHGITVDLGGGSTEILSFSQNTVKSAVSLPFGCLSLYHSFFDENRYEFDACCQFVFSHLERSAPKKHGHVILLSGGSAKAILKYKNVMENKHSMSIGVRQFGRIRNHYLCGDAAVREKIAQDLKDRYRLIPPALAVFMQITRFYRQDHVLICRSGVREGYLWNYLQNR